MSPFARWAFFVARRRRAVLLASGLVVLAGFAFVPVFRSNLLGIGYDTPGSESDRARDLVRERTGVSEQALLVVSSERLTARDPAFDRALERAVRAVEHEPLVQRVLPPGSPDGGRVSPDGRVATATVLFEGDVADRQDASEELQPAIDAAVPAGIEADLTGTSPLFADLIGVEERDLVLAESVGLPIAFAILILALGSIVAAGLPLGLALAGVGVTFGLLGVVSLFHGMNIFVENIVAMIGIGVGIDYALLIVRRFREERAVGAQPGRWPGEHRTEALRPTGALPSDDAAALARTLATAGRTVVFSGAIVAVSLVPLALTGLPFFGESAAATVLVVAIMVLAALTLLPAALIGLGDRLDRFRLPAPRRPGARGGWERWARAVMARPWPVLLVGVTLLLAAALPALGLRTGTDLNARAMPEEPSARALELLEASFPAASLAPVEVVVRTAGGSPDAAEQASADGEGPSGAAEGAAAIMRSERRLADVRSTTLGGDAALLTATPRVPVDSQEATGLVRDLRTDLRASLPEGAEPLVAGTTAETVDYTDETNAATPWVVGTALGLSFMLLMWVFRSPVLALKAIVANLLSIGAAFGLVVLVFQHGLGEEVLGFTSLGYIQGWLPLTLFMLLFGLSMDYEVFMVTRMREEWERTGDTVEAVARGLERTGGVVTSAAAIMVAVFGAFVLTSIPEIKQMGFGLAAAILIDATIVRAAVVPAFMRIAGRWNWWIPARLDRLLPSLEH